MQSAAVNTVGTSLVVQFSRAVTGHAGYALSASGGAAGLTYASGEGGKTLVFTIDRTIAISETLSLDYTPGDTQDSDTTTLGAIVARAVLNGSLQTFPLLTAAVVNAAGTSLTLTFDQAVNSHTGFTVTPSGGAASLTYTSGDGTASKVFTLGRAILAGETITLDYTPGNVVGTNGLALAAIVEASVTNSSTQVP